MLRKLNSILESFSRLEDKQQNLASSKPGSRGLNPGSLDGLPQLIDGDRQ